MRVTPMTTSTTRSLPSDRTFFIFNAVLSAAALSLLAWLLLFHRGIEGTTLDLRFMPGVNAVLNGTAAVLLVAGWVAIKQRRPDIHRYLMVSAFVASALFLVGYLAYHSVHGDTKFGGVGAVRTIYFVILISHVLLSVGIVPMSLAAFWFAYKREFNRHTRVTRILHPIWLYVSVTGVVVFLMLKPYY